MPHRNHRGRARREPRLLGEAALAIRDKLHALVAELAERRDLDRWSCVEAMTISQVAEADADEVPLSYWLHGFLKCIEEGLAAEVDDAWHTFEKGFRADMAEALENEASRLGLDVQEKVAR